MNVEWFLCLLEFEHTTVKSWIRRYLLCKVTGTGNITVHSSRFTSHFSPSAIILARICSTRSFIIFSMYPIFANVSFITYTTISCGSRLHIKRNQPSLFNPIRFTSIILRSYPTKLVNSILFHCHIFHLHDLYYKSSPFDSKDLTTSLVWIHRLPWIRYDSVYEYAGSGVWIRYHLVY